MFDSVREFFVKGKKPAKRRFSVLGDLLPINSGTSMWVTPTSTYQGYCKEGYQDNADVYACINIIARCCKGVDWKVLQKSKTGKTFSEISSESASGASGQLYGLLHKPNYMEGWKKFMENWIGLYLLSGNSYILRNGPGKDKPPSELWHLRPDRMEIIYGDPRNPIAGYKMNISQKIFEYKPDRFLSGVPWQTVMHLKKFNPLDDYYGLSPVAPGALAIDQNNAAAKVNYALLKNGLRTSGAFIVEGNYDEDQLNELRQYGDTVFSGPDNAGKFLIVGGGIKDWKEFGLKPKDMDWAAGQQLGTKKICAVFGVPVDLIGETQNSTYAHYREVRKALYMETVMPLLDELQEELNRWLTPLFDDRLVVCYDKDDIEAVKDERHVVWQRADQAVRSGWITPNEARAMVGIEKFTDPTGQADQLRIPTRDTLVGDPESNPSLPDQDPTEGTGKGKLLQ